MNYTLNKIDDFDPYNYIEIAKDRRGNEITNENGPLRYLRTDAKILWFRKVYPKGAIQTQSVIMPEKEFGEIVRFTARVLFPDGSLAAEWQHQETVWDVADMDQIVSKAQTIAVGKALSKAGFGCEIELELGLNTEGETPEEAPAEKPAEKKRRSKPKKEAKEEAKEDKNIEDEVNDLLKAIESSVSEEKPEEPEEPKEKSVEEEIEELLEMKLEVTDKAPINIKALEGLTLREVLDSHKTFGNLVKTRPNIRKSISEDCANALIFIDDNKE